MGEFTILPNQGFTNQQAGTALLTDNENAPLEAFWRGQEMQYRNKLFDYKKRREDADNILKLMDFDKTGIRQQDLQPITDYAHENLYQYVYDNPKALNPSFDDKESMAQASKVKENESQAHYLANKSKLIRAQYDLYKKDFIDHDDADGIRALEEWYKQPLDKIGDFQYTPPPDNNIMTLARDVEKALTTGTTDDATISKDASGQLKTHTVTSQNIDLTKLPEAAKSIYATDRSWKAQADQTFNKLTPEQKTKYGNDPSNVLVELLLPHINAEQKSKDTFKADWMAQYATKKTVPIEYETGGVTIGSTKKGKEGYEMFEMTSNGRKSYDVKDSTGKTVKSFSDKVEAQNFVNSGTIEAAGEIGGWDLSKTGNAPSNILIRPPLIAYDVRNNKQIGLQDIGANAWNVDILKVKDYYVDDKGVIIPTQNVNSSNKGKYTVKRFATVNRTYQSDKGTVNKTYLIPFDESVAKPIENAGFDLTESTKTQNTQSSKQKVYKGLDSQGNPIFE